MHGVINLLKPTGMTSHDAVGFMRRLARTKKVGHTGTLDPAAAGVLPLCIGNATRLADYLQAGRKRYIAEATFGYETDSLDATGMTVAESDASKLDAEALNEALSAFRGDILQTPPLYSAIKQGGKKLYELARAGAAEVEIAARQVQIHDVHVTRFVPAGVSPDTGRPRAVLNISCGSGTYVRSLLRDIGRALGTHATMTFLVRTESGVFHIDAAQTPEQLAECWQSCLLSFEDALRSCAPAAFTDDEILREYLAGRTRRCHEAEQKYRAAGHAGQRLLFFNSARTAALLSEPATGYAGYSAKLFHLT